jgi:UDP-N-acetylglucosamine 2-epimerase (non-hydrolysing)
MLVPRKVTDRQEGVIAGTAELVGTDVARIMAKTNALLDDASYYRRMSIAHHPCGDGKASDRIVHYLESYRPT